MVRVLITGMSGTGKSTLLAGLAAYGLATLDTDDDGWTLADARWDLPRMIAHLEAHDTIAVSGTVENQGEIADWFDHVVLLSAPLPIILDRVAQRTNNPYGRSEADRAEIAAYVLTVEPLLRRSATLELDATQPTESTLAAVLALFRE